VLQRLPSARETDVPSKEVCPDVTPLQRNFRAFRAGLIKDGWFKRNYIVEAAQMASWGAMLALGIKLATTADWKYKLLSVLPIAIANSYAGWLAHDYVHGTDKFCNFFRNFGAVTAGLSTTMWCDKHNMHHAKVRHVATFKIHRATTTTTATNTEDKRGGD